MIELIIFRLVLSIHTMKLLLQSSCNLQSHLKEIQVKLGEIFLSTPIFINSNTSMFSLSGPISKDLEQELNLKCIDFAILDDFIPLSEFSLCVMDMDSTLISIECIDEIADMFGKKEDIALITKSAMMGEIDFSQSLVKRVSLLEGLREEMLFKVIKEKLRFNEGAQDWIDQCRKNNITTVLVSGGFDYFADYVRDALGIDEAISNKLEIKDKKLTGKVLGRIVNDEVKAQTVRDFQTKLKIGKSKTIAIGDGANDLKMLAESEYSIAYHAKPIVQQKARFKLNYSDFHGVLNLFKPE